MKNIKLNSYLILLGVVAILTLFFSCEKGPNFREFDYPAPVVNDFYPKQGYIGSDVTIEGADFGDAVGAVKVYFGEVLADTVRSVEDSQIVVQVPPNGTTNVLITVEIFGKKDVTSEVFTYLPSAKLIAVNKEMALVGDELTISGENFGTDISLVQVFIGANHAEVSSVTPNEVKFVVPDVSSGNILLVVDGQRLAGPYLMVGVEKLGGTLIGHSGSWNNNPASTIEAGVDGDIDTYVDAPSGVTGYIGYDLGEKFAAVLRSMRFVPRSTDPSHPSRMVGGEIRGSNDPSLATYVVLYTISETPPIGVYTEVAIDNEESFRYIYYTNPKQKNCNLAEIEFYGNIVEVEYELGQYVWSFAVDGDNLGWEAQQNALWSVTGGTLNVTFSQATGNKRADLKQINLPVTVHTGNYPILAMKADIPSVAHITFDTNLGEFGPGYNKYSKDFLESHGVYYWDMSVLPLRDEVRSNEEITFEKTFQFKIADIPQDNEAKGYKVEWIRTFASKEALGFFLNQ
jgi:hypothetical protein